MSLFYYLETEIKATQQIKQSMPIKCLKKRRSLYKIKNRIAVLKEVRVIIELVTE